MIYLASPYSHTDPAVVQQRFEAACRAAGALMKGGGVVFSPIAHTHSIAQFSDMPADWEFWKKQDFALLAKASTLCVLMIPGWAESTGVRAEIEFAKANSIPVRYIVAE